MMAFETFYQFLFLLKFKNTWSCVNLLELIFADSSALSSADSISRSLFLKFELVIFNPLE